MHLAGRLFTGLLFASVAFLLFKLTDLMFEPQYVIKELEQLPNTTTYTFANEHSGQGEEQRILIDQIACREAADGSFSCTNNAERNLGATEGEEDE
ncbi:MAG: hypothetical protein MN733_12480 [Nitrososphaera sp.]|nr:hypothetical protein [Nitrososphaera sp.]